MSSAARQGSALVATLVAIALILVAAAAVALMWPPTRTAAPRTGGTVDGAALRAGLDVATVRSGLEAIAACGPRSLSRPGLDRAADLIVALGRELDAEVVELPVRTPVPRTRRADLVGGGTTVTVLPFKPNLLQPGVTPAGGLRGQLVAVDTAWDASGQDGAGAIALVDAASPPGELGLHWPRYAARGFAGLVVTHRDGLQAVDWREACAGAEASAPVVFPRVAAAPEVSALAGGDVVLTVDVAWEDVSHRAILLRVATPGASEAVALTTSYDQVGAIPDLQPGPGQDLALATSLAAFRALAAQRSHLGRDLLLVAVAGGANADDGLSWLLSAIGSQQGGETGRLWWRDQAGELVVRRDRLVRLLAAARTPGLLRDGIATMTAIDQLAAADRAELMLQLRRTINDRVDELNEEALAARLTMLRAAPAPGQQPPPALLDAFVHAKQVVGRVSAMSSWPPATFIERGAKQVEAQALDTRLEQRLERLAREADLELARAEAAVRIGSACAGYGAVLAVELRPAAAAGKEAELLAVQRGSGMAPGATGQAFSELCQRLVAEAGADAPQLRPLAGARGANEVDAAIAQLPLHATQWSAMGFPSMALVHADRSDFYRTLTGAGGPAAIDPPPRYLRLAADLLGLLAAGRGEVALPQRAATKSWGGQVMAGGIGAGLVPDHPLAGALVSAQVVDRPGDARLVGHGTALVMRVAGDGSYGVPVGPFAVAPAGGGPYTPIVAAFGPDGVQRWAKDSGAAAQRLFRSESFGWNPPSLINLVAFRGEPVTVTDRIDPRLLRPWAEVRPVARDGLAALPSFAAWDGRAGLSAFLLPADRHVIFTLNAGSPENPLVRKVRSVLLGEPTPPGTQLNEGQPDGIGYLPADRPMIRDAARAAADSLLRLDAARLRQQVERGLAHPDLAPTAAMAADGLKAAVAATDQREALKSARRAGALAQQNHDRIQETVSQAVANIVWYLCLLVPFALFTEKLVIGSSDVRRQILWSGCIFLVSFVMIAVLHPAFPLLNSPAMILLGFVIMLIALGVSAVFLGRFQENLRGLQAKRGQVEGARVDVLGVTVTAFLLGLNGLSRRKVRTGLTSATLVLITFALICFAGVQRRAEVVVTAVGPAPYQGMLVEDETTGVIGADEVAAMRARYAPHHRVCERSVVVGTEDARTKERTNPQIDLAYDDAGTRRGARCQGALLWQHHEPLAARLRLVAGRPWAESEAAVGAPLPILVSEAVAEDLRITAEAVATGPVATTVNGQVAVIAGVFSSDSLAALRDLNGRTVLPYDIEAMLTVRRSRSNAILAYPEDPTLPAARVVILPNRGFKAVVPGAENRLVSCAVVLEGLPYREASELIADHQRLSGLPLAYGLDGTAFVGRTRGGGGFGGVDLLIPLLIAALTVLNTMRGSVYERRDEIAVFNAVGIAPRFIAAMFFAEALVYAVVGAVAGYLLSLLLGRGSAMLGIDLGLQLDVASLAPVWASLALAAAVFLSTWFPARQAAEIASPSDDAGWRMPEPEDDRMAIELPFAFDARDKVAVLVFFARWFRDHGEGGSGPFQAGDPQLSAARVDGAAVPRIDVRIWLKPFDLGVSQELTIELHPSPSGEAIARLVITRLNGSRESWLRLNRPFMGVLRRHFLFWRAVDVGARAELYAEGCAALRAGAEEPVHG